MRYVSLILLTLGLAGLSGCALPGETVDRTQTNLVDKRMFAGEWWYSRTVTDIDDDAAWAIQAGGAGAPWEGATSNFDIISNSGHIGRIRWVIDEDFLYAFRSYEIVAGASEEARDPDFLGQPLAVFPVEAHVDVRRGFSPVTGEADNTIIEVQDRQWYDRQFMRVDWQRNMVTFGLFGGLDLYGANNLLVGFSRQPVDQFVDEGGNDIDAADRPQFVRVSEDPDYRFANEWPEDEASQETVHFMSFVTKEVWTPQRCTSEFCSTAVQIGQRHAFLRIPPNHEYAVEQLPNSQYDRFGIIRTENRTYVRGGEDRSEIRQHCNSDADCNGALCYIMTREERFLNPTGSDHYCVGGLTSNFGETDFLTYYRLRHNFYSDSLTDRECRANWECDNRYGHVSEDVLPRAETDGSVCDQAARLCTIPLRNRPIREVTYHLSPQYPRHLVRNAFVSMLEWNEAFMTGNRELHGTPQPTATNPRQQCQGIDPTRYCYCDDAQNIRALEVATDGTCEHRSDFFAPPADRGEDDPFDCWISVRNDDGTSRPEDDTIDPPSPQSFADYSQDVYRYQFEGSECMLVLKTNSCDFPVGEGEAPAPCEQLGDIRYQFFNYTPGAGAGWCGVMQQNQDPLTGEAVISPVNMGGQCLERVATAAIEFWPVLRGEASEDALFTGENIRNYYERINSGTIHRPVGIANAIEGNEFDPAPGRPAIPANINAWVNDRMESLQDHVMPLSPRNDEARSLILSDRLSNLAGSPVERRLVEAMAIEQPLGFPSVNPVQQAAFESSLGIGVRPTIEQQIEELSPFRSNYMDHLTAERRLEQALERNYIYFPRETLFTSRYNQWWAEAFRGRSIPEANIRWMQAFHGAVMKHEMGHGLGLEHNFAASYDRDHYPSGYHNLVTRQDDAGNLPFALPRLQEFDLDGDGAIVAAEADAWSQSLRETREARLEVGIGNNMTSSLMDYNGDLSDMSGVGRYDRAAVYFNYFNQVEAFNAPIDDVLFPDGGGTSLDDLLRSDLVSRDQFTFYGGGEQCQVDADCPFTRGSEALIDGQPFYQRCIRNTRFSNIPTDCGEGEDSCLCSSFDDDFEDYIEGAGRDDWFPTGRPEHAQVLYQFCSNPRVNDISWCSTFDAGESFQETIDHFRQMWTEAYPRNYFRNFRRGFMTGSRALRYIIDAAKIFQHFYFRFFFEPGFGADTGPLGANDQFFSAMDSMNWLAELAQLPDVGSYVLNEDTNTYEFMGDEMDMVGSDVTLEPGEGFYRWSRYQDGLYGFFRLERAGVFQDQNIALRALTIRDWGLNFTVDERFFVNYYDLFDIEMTELFGGYITNNEQWFAPRMEVTVGDDGEPQPEIFYLNYNRGNCQNPTTGFNEPCRGSNETTFTQPHIQGTSNQLLRTFAAIYALAEFPVFYNPSFETRLIVFRLDNADGFEIPDVQADGEATCGFGGVIEGSGHELCDNPADADYAVYTSDRLNIGWVAAKVRDRLTFNLEEEQLGFQLLVRMMGQQDRINELEAQGDLTAIEEEELNTLRFELNQSESFVDVLTEVGRAFGISSFF